MSVNLSKNRSSMLQAWENLHKPDSKNDWVLYGYDGKSSDLKLVGEGEDGLEELVDGLSGGKILYAGLRVIDPNTKLPKIVFINWQGEGVPATTKGKCANHLRDITNLFKGSHVQINARCEDDVDEDVVMEKVKKSSGANYSFHNEKPKAFIPQGVVGTNYTPKRPGLEIDVKKKNEFWAATENEEKENNNNNKNEGLSKKQIACIAGAGVTAVAATPVVLGLAGFGASGVVGGSLAAAAQSYFYGAFTSGVFSSLQSAGVLGVSKMTSVLVGGSVSGAVYKMMGKKEVKN